MIEKDITPRLEKLRTQRQDYMSYHKVCEDLEKLQRLVAAYHYYVANVSKLHLAMGVK